MLLKKIKMFGEVLLEHHSKEGVTQLIGFSLPSKGINTGGEEECSFPEKKQQGLEKIEEIVRKIKESQDERKLEK